MVKIVSIKASMNLGLSEDLTSSFPNIIPIHRPLLVNVKVMDPSWLSGYVSAEGNFFINIINSKTITGKQVILMFTVSQHSRDANLLMFIANLLDCGNYYSRSNRNEDNFTVTKFSDIEQKVILFFKNYPIYGIKSLDYSDFCKVVEIIKAKEHLTIKGLAKIEKIKNEVNTKRTI